MEHHVSTSESEKRGEDRQGKEHDEFSGLPRSKKKSQVTRENEDKNKKKKPRKDEGQKLNEKEEERKRITQKRLRKRSRSKEMCDFSEEKKRKKAKLEER